MKIKFKYAFKYMLDTRTVQKVLPGTYEVPRQVDKEVADLALGLGRAVIVPEDKTPPIKRKTKPGKRKMVKKAPENKGLGAK